MSTGINKAILLTGASARISQEVAILDQLIKQKNLNISPENTLLAGFSSGSLNLIAINKLLNTPEWDNYYKSQILFPLKTSDVYTFQGKLPFNTGPLHSMVNSFLAHMNISDLKDLPYQSSIIAYQSRFLFSKTRWANSSNQDHAYLKLSDLMMASTAIPIVFPHRHIQCEPDHHSTFPHGDRVKYVDGGTGGTFDRFSCNIGNYVKKHGMFDDIYVISPMRECETEEFDPELENLSKSIRTDIHDEIQKFLGAILQKSLVKFLKKLDSWEYEGKPIAKNIYVCIPELQKNFPIMSFDEQQQQYQAVYVWAEQNPDKLAIPVQTYLK